MGRLARLTGPARTHRSSEQRVSASRVNAQPPAAILSAVLTRGNSTAILASMTPAEIRKLRADKKMTQDEFAKLLGLETRFAVSKLESGAREPKGPLLELLNMIRDQAKPKR